MISPNYLAHSKIGDSILISSLINTKNLGMSLLMHILMLPWEDFYGSCRWNNMPRKHGCAMRYDEGAMWCEEWTMSYECAMTRSMCNIGKLW